jgi:molybdopterin biosynthesis enzyme
MTGLERALPRPAVRVAAFQPKRCVLINTTLPGLKPSVIAATTDITRARVNAVGGTLLNVVQCEHAFDATTACLKTALASQPDIILIAGASATVDRGDIVPAAIVAAGGEIDHFGMPVDPGNFVGTGSHWANFSIGSAGLCALTQIEWLRLGVATLGRQPDGLAPRYHAHGGGRPAG